MKNLLYKPSIEGCTSADFIPFYENGVFHLFYLLNHDLNPSFTEGISWYKTTTTNFVDFTKEELIIEHGSKEELDLCAFTGSVIKAFGKYFIFYTAHNIYIKKHGHQNECILRAIGDDLSHFKKDEKFILEAPANYDKCDFRDPFVYEDNGTFYMLVCARNSTLVGDSTGETIRFKSTDLTNWTFEKVIYSPREYQTHECPDLFKMGDFYYLIFSEYSDEFLTKYRIAKSPDGPWLKPTIDTFDGRAFYAAKTAFDGENRYIFGWLPTKAESLDRTNWLWGGNLVAHKLNQKEDGTLFVTCPQSINNVFNNVILQESFGLSNSTGFDFKNVIGSIESGYLLECDLIPSEGTYKFGLRLKHDLETDHSYGLQFDLNKKKVYVTKLPSFPPNEFNGAGLERPIDFNGKISLKIINDNDMHIVYLNNNIALSFRTYDYKSTGISVFVSNGSLEVNNLILKK